MEKLIRKIFNKETKLYTIFGVLTSIQNVVMFDILLKCGMAYRVANIITLVVVKLTAYLCNKNFVFKSHCANFLELLMEFARFVFWRGATMLLDYFGLIFLVEIVKMPKLPGKVIMTVFVIAVNYITGKRHVFKNKKTAQEEQPKD